MIFHDHEDFVYPERQKLFAEKKVFVFKMMLVGLFRC
jgi:hypothetical protein